MARVRVRQRIGKYRIVGRIAEGGFATVYRAHDTITGIPVALKLPNAGTLTGDELENFRREVRLTAKLDHPNVLPVKDAGFIDGTFVVVYPLGERSLADRMTRRMSIRTVARFADQMLEAAAFAHRHRIMHCDIKPENFILFTGNRLRLADFGIAKSARRTLQASGSGTVGYIAPEQAMGKPSFRSDVFSLGLILYRMLTGQLPEWPFDWPPPGFDRLRRSVHPEVIAFLRKAMEVNHRQRYPDAVRMLAAFRRLKSKVLRSHPIRRSRVRSTGPPQGVWRTMRRHEWFRRYRKELALRGSCPRCSGPVSEMMRGCPTCGVTRRARKEETRFRSRCPRCKRGVKTDWRFCPWCYGAAINPSAARRYADAAYVARCANPRCQGKVLMRFMRYCPWCRRKVRQRWKIDGVRERCVRCEWGVLPDYWDFCPWCTRRIRRS